jgi:tetratricopeptide (TPR) repeat protein
MHQSYLFDILASNSDIKNTVAEYYFSKQHYFQAIELFNELLTEHAPNASIYQKIGYSYQQTSHIAKALDAYLKADLLEPDDLWTIRKTALCYKLSGNFEKALESYIRLDYLKPNQTNTLLQIGKCYVELSKFKEALSIYFKLDAELDGNLKVWKAITWCSFATANLAQAEYYVNKVLELDKNAQNYLNAGHIAWCSKKFEDAINYYIQCLELQQRNWDLFFESIQADKTYILANGVDKEEFMLLFDEILYRMNSESDF